MIQNEGGKCWLGAQTLRLGWSGWGFLVGKSSVSICLHFSSWINSPEKPLSVFCLAGKGPAAGVLGAECMKRVRAWRVVPSNRTYGHLAPLFSVLDSISQLCLGYPQSRDPPHSPSLSSFFSQGCSDGGGGMWTSGWRWEVGMSRGKVEMEIQGPQAGGWNRKSPDFLTAWLWPCKIPQLTLLIPIHQSACLSRKPSSHSQKSTPRHF